MNKNNDNNDNRKRNNNNNLKIKGEVGEGVHQSRGRD